MLSGSTYRRLGKTALPTTTMQHPSAYAQGGGGGGVGGDSDRRCKITTTACCLLGLASLAGILLERSRVDALRSDLDRTRTELSDARAQLADLRTQHDEARTAGSGLGADLHDGSILASKREEGCPLDGSFDPPGDEIAIDYAKIRGMDKSPLERVQNFTTPDYVNFLLKDAGTEHYPFLNYLSNTYGDCRHFADIGTRVVASSVAVGSNLKSPVWTFDLPRSHERHAAFRGQTEEEYQARARSIGLNIKFHNVDLLKVSDEELRDYFGTWFVFLDTFHEPDTVPFEREFFQRMLDIEFKGVLGLDDIHLNSEMKKWWKELQESAIDGGYTTYDISEVGHFSGTGLVDFSGKVVIKS